MMKPDKPAREQTAALVRRVRTKHELTQVKLAQHLGCRHATVLDWEHARSVPQPVFLRELRRLEALG